jgi:peptidyl-prolyl cis-trans isomerase B (cyclophilin B)
VSAAISTATFPHRRSSGLLAAALAVLALAGCGSGGETTPTAGARATAADAIVRTSEGSFTIELDAKTSPNTVASFERLARKGFFDGTIFHRIVPGFVIQGGDPTGTGTGGPGYSTVDKPPADTRYTRGVVAMAKTSAEPAGTAGSQFFVVTGKDAGLPPEYAVLGKVVAGMPVVLKIGALGDPQTEQPTKKITIEKIAIRET